jgi:hypothetical protein
VISLTRVAVETGTAIHVTGAGVTGALRNATGGSVRVTGTNGVAARMTGLGGPPGPASGPGMPDSKTESGIPEISTFLTVQVTGRST